MLFRNDFVYPKRLTENVDTTAIPIQTLNDKPLTSAIIMRVAEHA